MPLVILHRDKRFVSDEVLTLLLMELPQFIAEALSSTNDKLESRHVKIWIWEKGEFDVTNLHLSIQIFAGKYPDRVFNKQERVERIVKDIRLLLPDLEDKKRAVVKMHLGETSLCLV